MTKLETIDFENKEVLLSAIKATLSGADVNRNYESNGETKTRKLISKHRLYFGNQYSLNINEADNGKVYMSIDYFGAEDRIRMAKNKNSDPDVKVL